MMTMQLPRSHEKGFSIIELLVSITVGLILIAGISSVYLASKLSYTEVERMSRITQNSRFALQIITESLQLAGFVGEVSIGNVSRDVNLEALGSDCSGNAALYDIDYYMMAGTVASNSVFGCIDDAVDGTSAIMIKNARPNRIFDPVAADLRDDLTYIWSNSSSGFILDGADASGFLEGVPEEGSAWEYQAQIFYIRDNGGVPTLSRQNLEPSGGAMNLVTEDLIAGVEAISFLFGLDTDSDGDIDTYKTIGEMINTEWPLVFAVEVNVLTRSETEDPRHTDEEVYNLAGLAQPLGPFDDQFHRLVMQSTVSLRNPKFVIRGENL